MLNPDFYPTPDAVIEMMVEPFMQEQGTGYRRYLAVAGKTILDPSAGRGDILEFVSERMGYNYDDSRSRHDKNLYGCELDPELRAIVQDKGFKIIGTDFLEYSGDTRFDLILMNPPFAKADKHVLHAYDVVTPGGHVVALVNAETIRNPFTESRQYLARLIEDYGSTEELGRVFMESDRKTDVEVSLIRLQKPDKEDPFKFEWHNVNREGAPQLDEHTFADQLATRDVIGNMITQYAALKEQFVALMRAADGIKFYGRGLTKNGVARDAWKIAREMLDAGRSLDSYAQRYNAFTDEMRQQIWGVVLTKLNIEKFMTHNVRENFSKYSYQHGFMDFTTENVGQLIELVLNNSHTILEQAVTDLFDLFTKYHFENRCHIEGWKTNERFKVNRKIILPNWVSLSEFTNLFSLNSYHWSEYSDVDKVACYLTGENYDRCYTITQALERRFQVLGRVGSGYFDGTCESQFFKLRFFKKGTLHIEFKDSALWQEFNLRACAGKQWLPEPEMRAYQNRKHSPFEKPKPVAPVVAALSSGRATEIQAQSGQQLTLGDFLSAAA